MFQKFEKCWFFFFGEIWLFPNFCTMHSAAGLAKFCTMHSAAGLAKFCFLLWIAWELLVLLVFAWELLVLLAFWKFSKSFKSRKIWPGVCPILEILSFCLRLLKILEIRKYSKCRFLGKIGQGSALHWCFRFLKFSKCGFLRKFDQGSALYLNSQCLNCLITFWDVFGTLFFLLSSSWKVSF